MAILTTAIPVPAKIDRQDLGDKIIELQVWANNGVLNKRIADTDLVGKFQDVIAVFAAVPVTGLPTFGAGLSAVAKPDVSDLEKLIIMAVKAINTHNGH